MSTLVRNRSHCTIALSADERDGLLGLLRQTSGLHDRAQTDQALIRALIAKLERAAPDDETPTAVPPTATVEASPVTDELYIDAEGRFQLPAADLGEFIDFLRDHEVRVELESGDTFRAAGQAYGYGRLLHLYDSDSVGELYRNWERARGRGVEGVAP